MLIFSEFDIQFQLPVPTPMVALLYLHPSWGSRIRSGNDLLIEPLGFAPPVASSAGTVTPGVQPVDYIDSFGNRCARFVAPAGHVRLSGSSVVEADPYPDRIYADAVQSPIEELPDEVLQFLLASRYCEVDRFSALAQDLFGHTTPGWGRAVAIRDWVHQKITFNYNAARPTKTAMDVFIERTGVCRDFQHLAITLSRCMNIPARYVTGYIGDIRMAYSGPGDFSAWYQVFLNGQWIDLDSRHNYPRLGRILMATGRDAADVAITTSFGAAHLTHFFVESNEVDEAGNRIPRPEVLAHNVPSFVSSSAINTPTQTNNSEFSPTQTQPATS